MAALAPGSASVPAFGGDPGSLADERGLLACEAPLPYASLSAIVRPASSDVLRDGSRSLVPRPRVGMPTPTTALTTLYLR